MKIAEIEENIEGLYGQMQKEPSSPSVFRRVSVAESPTNRASFKNYENKFDKLEDNMNKIKSRLKDVCEKTYVDQELTNLSTTLRQSLTKTIIQKAEDGQSKQDEFEARINILWR